MPYIYFKEHIFQTCPDMSEFKLRLKLSDSFIAYLARYNIVLYLLKLIFLMTIDKQICINLEGSL